MQDCTDSSGFLFVTLYITDTPPSLSSIWTVPAEKLFPGFDVVLENAEKVPKPTRMPAKPSTSTVSRAFLALSMTRVLPDDHVAWPPGRRCNEGVEAPLTFR